MSDIEDAYFSDTPTFAVYAEAFGLDNLIHWIKAQLLALDFFTELKIGADINSLQSAAEMFARNYGGLKITEFLLFMARFKLGYYGKMYGYYDPIAIGEALRTFLKQRAAEVARIESERANKEREKNRLKLPKGYTSYTLYKTLKSLAEKGDKKAIKELNKWKEISA